MHAARPTHRTVISVISCHPFFPAGRGVAPARFPVPGAACGNFARAVPRHSSLVDGTGFLRSKYLLLLNTARSKGYLAVMKSGILTPRLKTRIKQEWAASRQEAKATKFRKETIENVEVVSGREYRVPTLFNHRMINKTIILLQEASGVSGIIVPCFLWHYDKNFFCCGVLSMRQFY